MNMYMECIHVYVMYMCTHSRAHIEHDQKLSPFWTIFLFQTSVVSIDLVNSSSALPSTMRARSSRGTLHESSILCCQISQKISSRLHLLYKVTLQRTFENFYLSDLVCAGFL